MKKWAERINEWGQKFMRDRCGVDELSVFLSITALVMILVSVIPGLRFFYLAALVPFIFVMIRSFSKNIGKRQEERTAFLDAKHKAEQRKRLFLRKWRDRKTHRYYRCPYCGVTVRIRRPDRGKKFLSTVRVAENTLKNSADKSMLF